ncbi:DUF5658 family protein [Oligoflexia bacterium]|nr:DUF5658 family protein [Oligoflexia bacterium]
MAQAAENIIRSGYAKIYQFPTAISASYERLGVRTPAKEVIILGIVLAVLQILDGILTGIGIYHFGTSAEGNLVLKSLMDQIGYAPALILIKSLAILIVAALCYLSSIVAWLKSALKAVIFIYLGAAIIPWTAIIVTRIL